MVGGFCFTPSQIRSSAEAAILTASDHRRGQSAKSSAQIADLTTKFLLLAMAKSELIDARVSVDQSKRAIAALLDHEEKQSKKAEETQLLGRSEQYIWLVLGIKKMHPGHKLKPRKMYASS